MKQNFNGVFKNKKILITGHTGFKGSWLTAWLKLLGAKITGVSLSPPSDPYHYDVANLSKEIYDFKIDIRDSKKIEDLILDLQPDYVFHLAAQPLVRKSYLHPKETWTTNLIGTQNVLEGLRKVENKCISVLITSDKCYENVEWNWGYRENDPLGGLDPYSASKGAAEILIRSYKYSFFHSSVNNIFFASARAGNVIGGGDWGQDRLVPDCVKAWSKGSSVELRNPYSTRPWQHVLEPLSGYLSLAMELTDKAELHGQSFNFGPSLMQNKSVIELVKEMKNYWGDVNWNKISKFKQEPYESGLLKLNCEKAMHHLHWQPVMEFRDTIRMTAEWYKFFYQNLKLIEEITYKQIKEYSNLAKSNGLKWAQ